LSWSLSVGASWLGATLKWSRPVLVSMMKCPASSPPASVNTSVSPSGSDAITVVTAVMFSATAMLALAPPPSDVMAGALLVLPTVMVKLSEVLRPPLSVAVTSTLKLPTSPSAGVPLKLRVAGSKLSQAGRAEVE